MMNWLADIQQTIYASVGSHLGAFAASRDWTALLAILPLGIVFGAMHALTPGHSKTLLASYLIGSRLAFLRGLAVSSILAATHVLSSVLIALFATQLLTRTLVGAGRAPIAEDISRGLLVLIGAWFVARALRGNTHHPQRGGVAVGFIAGLIPCPLTLFVMVTALARGGPAAGATFAASMFLGIALTLGAVAWCLGLFNPSLSRTVSGLLLVGALGNVVLTKQVQYRSLEHPPIWLALSICR